jgi:phage baseplate assembly protein W
MAPAPDDPRAFLGVGWAFPLQLDPSGEIAMATHEEDIRQAIRLILGTIPGERAMRPDFGAGLHALAFEPLSARTIALARHRVEEALTSWEPRIDRITVDVSAEPSRGRLLLDIRYRVRATNIFYNLVYPFYRLESRPA